MPYCFAAICGDDNSAKIVNHVEITNDLGAAVKILNPTSKKSKIVNILITESGFHEIEKWNGGDSSVYIFIGTCKHLADVVARYNNNMADIFKDLIASEDIYRNTLRKHGLTI
ncbi:hypothetical protein GGF41_007327 [Coemansia sp. RSA 2531]|nr:hypothetical protein GGF41_007327 [Coemansia sp. RSA 2531]